MNAMDRIQLQKLRDLPIEGVAERLGLRVVRHKALCPFHDDHHASLSFKVSKNTWPSRPAGGWQEPPSYPPKRGEELRPLFHPPKVGVSHASILKDMCGSSSGLGSMRRRGGSSSTSGGWTQEWSGGAA